MSIYFQTEERVVWNPSNGVARAFLAMTAAAEEFVGVASGFSAVVSDEVTVDVPQLRVFRAAMGEVTHRATAHMFQGYLECLAVMQARASGEASDLEIAKAMPV